MYNKYRSRGNRKVDDNMKKKIEAIATVLALIGFCWFGCSYYEILEKQTSGAELHRWNLFNVVINIYDHVHASATEPPEETKEGNKGSKFDTSILEDWCGSPIGTLRMLGAWPCGDGILEDETGKQWSVIYVAGGDSLYLLWVDDMATEDNTDDEIVKVWKDENL